MGVKSQAERDKKRKKERKEGVLEKRPSSWDKSRPQNPAERGEMTENYQEKKGEQDQGLTQARFKPVFPTCAPYFVSLCHSSTYPAGI